MHAGRGELARLVDDLASGQLTGAPPGDFVLLLQEVVIDRGHELKPRIGERALATVYAPVRTTPTRTSGNAIVSTLALANMRIIELPWQRQPRSAIEAQIDIDHHQLFVVCAHLENRISFWRGGLFSDTARRRQAEALLAALPPSGAGIVGGDFNTWLGPNEPAWRTLLRRFPDTPAGRSEPTFHDRLVLDHLFFDLPDGWQVTRRVVSDRYGSDHHPVLAVIAVGRPGSAP